MAAGADIHASTGWRTVGRYEMGPRLASGGMAELHLARASGLHGFQKYLVVKRILRKWADDREFVEMFLDEARLAAQLDHPNVGHVHDIGEDDDGPFFAMEYIHGQHVLAIMRRCRERGVELDWGAFVALGSAAAAGLHHAHDRRGFDGRPLGIIHRDVSPTNILVSYEGAVKVVDFGIAKAASSRHSTRPSVRKGKMAYMSPEQCRGDTLDRRSDVFSLGIVLYELATLTRAFTGEGEFAVMNAIVNHDIEPASARRADIPAAIDRILARALQRDRDARYPTLRELQRDLDAYAAEAGIGATTAALAGVMEELFGSPPYPWESGMVADEVASTDVDPSLPATVVKSAVSIPASISHTPAAPSSSRSPMRWAALATAALAIASGLVVWKGGQAEVAVTPTPTEPANAPVPAAAVERPPPVTPEPPPSRSEPVRSEPASEAPVAPPAAEAPSPAPRGAAPARRTRRASDRNDAKPREPTAPAAFDPDAPAPRPQ